ncbi:MAG: Nif3-like dinuclear metal center hexameric protein [Bacteriovoracaceae bacterium]|jgi:dinuclear metal center YbgI/SA1388 family protein|nr:Nif3-like dinuclear metal center hexameric protein [Halobacteriovoraceae bacterium]MDP7319161.1 Nif3-like dinuclear metal center hexameric protein [Bacteriovoracaceae bacterium]
MINTKDLVDYLNKLLNIYDYQDYGPNGLQIQGKSEIKKIAFAVSATKDSIAKAVEIKADMLIVHHGLFWKFHGPRAIKGSFYRRVAPLIKHDINLLGYHLPLDGHMEYGNAASLAKKIGLTSLLPFGDHKGMPTGVKGKFSQGVSPKELIKRLSEVLEHPIMHSAPNDEIIKSMGIITGGANSDWRLCLSENLDSYLTGEMSEHDWNEAQEDNIHYFAGGHHATEKFGVQELMKHLHEKYTDNELEYFYIPSQNPA